MKKLLIGLTVLTLFAVAGSASAIHFSSGQTVIGNDFTAVSNTVSAGAYTGGNAAMGGNGGNGGFVFSGTANGGAGGSNSGDVDTGNATAYAGVINVVNSNLKSGCCWGKQKTIGNDFTFVKNEVVAVADTGENGAVGGDGGNGGFVFSGTANGGAGGSNSGDITTGNATAKAGAITVVNSNITRGF